MRVIDCTMTPLPCVPGPDHAGYPVDPTIGDASERFTTCRDAPGVLTFEMLSDVVFAAS